MVLEKLTRSMAASGWRKFRLGSLIGSLVLPLACLAADLRITAYYPGYKQTLMPASEIDFSVLTDLIHFSAVPNSDGSLNLTANGLTPANSQDVVSKAHASGCRVLVCVGGAGSEAGFQGATRSASLPNFVNNLVSLMSAYAYDGIDIDWEPLPAADFNQYTNLVIALRSALNGFAQSKLLTVAASAYPPYPDFSNAEYQMYASIQAHLDEINIMTYDLSGPYAGWVSWFNSPIYDGGATFPNSTRRLPSIDGPVHSFLNNGVVASKLGVGTPFYGEIWRGGAGTSTGGVTQPRQSWTNPPVVSAVPFSDIMSSYYQSNTYHWDSAAGAAYLSLTNPASTNDQFISYDDPHSVEAKVSYARNLGLGGLMIWELSQDYQPTAPAGSQHPLLQSIQTALGTPGRASIQLSNQQLGIRFTSAPLALYRVLATTNLGTSWITLTNGLPGDSNRVADTVFYDSSAISNQPRRFYRIKTPP